MFLVVVLPLSVDVVSRDESSILVQVALRFELPGCVPVLRVVVQFPQVEQNLHVNNDSCPNLIWSFKLYEDENTI